MPGVVDHREAADVGEVGGLLELPLVEVVEELLPCRVAGRRSVAVLVGAEEPVEVLVDDVRRDEPVDRVEVEVDEQLAHREADEFGDQVQRQPLVPERVDERERRRHVVALEAVEHLAAELVEGLVLRVEQADVGRPRVVGRTQLAEHILQRLEPLGVELVEQQHELAI